MGDRDATNLPSGLPTGSSARRSNLVGVRPPDGTATASSIVSVHDRPPPRPPLLVRFELGLAAFAPAIALLAIRTRSAVWLAIALSAIAVVSLLLLAMVILIVSKGNREPFDFTRIEDLGREVMGHVGAYLVPLLVGPTDSIGEMAMGVITLGIIVHIHIATGRVLVNPVLYLLGLHLYRAWSGDRVYYLLARSDVSSWHTSKLCIQVTDGIVVEYTNQKDSAT